MKTCLLVSMEVTKEVVQNLRMKMPNALVIFKSSYLRLLPACSKMLELTSKLERIDCFHLLFSNHSAVKREQIIFTLETMKRRQESGIGVSFIDS